VITQATAQSAEAYGKRGSVAFLGLGLGMLLAGVVALAGLTPRADAAFTEKIVFSSDRTTGVDNPTGDYEVFMMNPDGTHVRQFTFNEVDDWDPTLSPDGKKIAYESAGIQTSNLQGDEEVYVMNSPDGTGKKNLTNTGADADDEVPRFSPGGKRIAYESHGIQKSNPEGDDEIYVIGALDGLNKKNLTNNGAGVYDYYPDYSPDGTRFSYTSEGIQRSNPEGDREVYRMSVLDGTGKKNLTNNTSNDLDSDGGVQAR
jgi:Tol biopolymer transport system component